VKGWISGVGSRTAYIERGSPWKNGYAESFNARLRDELLNGEVFKTLTEARVLIEAWRKHYNTARCHSALGYRPPAPKAVGLPLLPAPPATSAVLMTRSHEGRSTSWELAKSWRGDGSHSGSSRLSVRKSVAQRDRGQ
jgi:hypothetical protein